MEGTLKVTVCGLRLGLALGLSLMLSATLFGQSRSSSSSSSSKSDIEKPIRRIWFGVSGNYTPLKLTTASTATNATTGESVSSSAANGQVGGGINVNFRVYGNFWLNAGGVYRYAGYDTNDSLNDANSTYYLERTRARYFDFPLLVRYTGPKLRWNKHAFYEGGAAFRDMTSVNTSTAAVNYLGYFCCAPASTTTIKNHTEGLVVGTGLVGTDDFGIKVAPEVRYTRWAGDTFHSSTVGSERDQLELAITFGY